MKKYKILAVIDFACLVIFITLFSLLEIYNTFAFPNFHPVISILIFVISLISVLSLSTILIKKIISIKREKSNKEKKEPSQFYYKFSNWNYFFYTSFNISHYNFSILFYWFWSFNLPFCKSYSVLFYRIGYACNNSGIKSCNAYYKK